MASIEKRTTTKGPRYDVRWRVGRGGPPRTRTFRRREDADRFRREVEHAELTGRPLDPRVGALTLNTYFLGEDDSPTGGTPRRGWIDARPLSRRTADWYRDLWRGYIADDLGAVELRSLTPERIRHWHASAREKGERQAARAGQLLGTVLRTAVKDRLLQVSPYVEGEITVPPSPERQLMTAEEMHTLAASIDESLRALVYVAAFAGLRRGELLGLQRADIDLLRKTIAVRRQAGYAKRSDGRGSERVVSTPKAHSDRFVSIDVGLATVLDDHMAAFTQPQAEAWVFAAPDGRPLDVNRLQREWSAARTAAGLEGYHLHDLRHFAGTTFAQSGATMRETMARLGHRTSSAAIRYQHAAETRDREVAERAAAAMWAAKPRATAAVRSLGR